LISFSNRSTNNEMNCPVKPRARLTESDVINIFRLKAANTSATSVGRLYGVSEKAIRDIWTGRTWANETWHLDMTRALVIKHAGRPAGCRDTKPRRKRPLEHCHANVQNSGGEISEPILCIDHCDESMFFDLSPFTASSGQTFHKEKTFASMMMSLDDQLFEWEQQNQPAQVDEQQNKPAQVDADVKADPFTLDWAQTGRSLPACLQNSECKPC
jgi:hypothetical protein